MIRSRAIAFTIHLAGWLLFLALPLLFMRDPRGETFAWPVLGSPYYWQFGLCYMLLFYLNTVYLFPRFFLRKQYGTYGLVVVVLLGGVYALQPFDQLLRHHREGAAGRGRPPVDRPAGPPSRAKGGPAGGQPSRGDAPFDRSPGGPDGRGPGGPGPRRVDITSLFLFGMVMALSTASRTVQQWHDTERRAARAEADKANAELSVLKAQIHPHFLFNTLNNIYALAVTGSPHTAASVLKLSKLMRYVTDEVQQDFVPLAREVECLEHYVDLQRLRLSRNTRVEMELSGETAGRQIAPLVLIPFVENVFKYGVSNHQPSTIRIRLRADAGTISFFCQNQVFAPPDPPGRTGVGIANTRRRLAHLYPGTHELTLERHDDRFTVQLTLRD